MSGSSFSTALLGGVLGAIIATVAIYPKINNIEEELSLRPPVVVIDQAQMAISGLPVGSTDEQIANHFNKTNEMLTNYAKAGYLILSRENILAAPDDYYLTKAEMDTVDLVAEQEADPIEDSLF